MAALRKLLLSLSSTSKNAALKQQTILRAAKALRVIGGGAGVTAVAGVFYYRSGLKSHVEARLFHQLLPSVSATEKASVYGLDDGDVYKSTFENRFHLFSSVEHEGQLYMTPLNFIESITLNEPRSRKTWKSLSKKELDKMMANTPPVWKGSSNLFRNLRERGIISYTEYLFLLCILTKPRAGFRIAFNMFDADGNEMVDKREFLVLEEIFRKKKDRKEAADEVQRFDQQSLQLYGYHKALPHSVLKKDSQHVEDRGMWDVLRRGTSQVLFSDLAERSLQILCF